MRNKFEELKNQPFNSLTRLQITRLINSCPPSPLRDEMTLYINNPPGFTFTIYELDRIEYPTIGQLLFSHALDDLPPDASFSQEDEALSYIKELADPDDPSEAWIYFVVIIQDGTTIAISAYDSTPNLLESVS